uniref:Histone deacetylase n=1 Tax=Chromera velia CCMP2878 TaxID=1169474 RepID=A0A0G4F891_9ALVE|eukprot:Cvel_15672.t1-p1 / transcript=Cvel_15672.t1 / gene=Cvel_15672 / organism=Chromera_velia_CCMP2878 / gene_product=Histone deacetylase 1, putative / transcript_product=Histone deacetylase 1, putative / location=Cvel_scaffold1170:6150-10776(-) / protein_length=471 / sequence_SO=supercontig / SO=protein_coding / is_pseudo=false
MEVLVPKEDEKRRRVSYFYDLDIGSYYYGSGHPMKPQRMQLTHELVKSFGLHKELEVIQHHKANELEIERFHGSEYIAFLSNITLDQTKLDWQGAARRFGVGEQTDCPIFEGLFDFQASCAGGSIQAARLLAAGKTDIAINWSGGLHHARKSEASGFCYVNDIVLGILELLNHFQRVMYIDIDIHHGDGVEEAFYCTNRVLTLSLHKFGDFFPGTGDLTDVGYGIGKHYSLNLPLNDGMDDASFLGLFKPVVRASVEKFRPEAIVLQCGADSLAGDRLGRFNLSIRGHAECLSFCRSFGVPLLILGGGGYTIRNVARCWAFETAAALGVEDQMPGEIPRHDSIQWYGPEFKLHLPISKTFPNLNTKEHLERLKMKALERLRYLEAAPGVEFAHVPPCFADYGLTFSRQLEGEEVASRGTSQHSVAGQQQNVRITAGSSGWGGSSTRGGVSSRMWPAGSRGTRGGGGGDDWG